MPDQPETELEMSEQRKINKAINAIEEFRKLDSEMQMQAALIFLLIARGEGMTVNDLVTLTGLTSSSCSRNVSLLSEIDRKRRPGHNLVVAKVDPDDRRVRNLYLNS